MRLRVGDIHGHILVEKEDELENVAVEGCRV
jgi:hypothetical protein